MTKRILVVEDQADLRGILRDLLTGSGYEVAEAADGQEKARSERPDLILMDIRMPVLEGTRPRGKSRPTRTSGQRRSSR
jgi:CheY-like chemotaxis protein